MARQANFFLHPDDLPAFDEHLKSFGEIVVVPQLQPEERPETFPDTLPRDLDEWGHRYYLLRPADAGSIPLRRIPNVVPWLVDDRELAAVHFDLSILRGDRILLGRLYFEPRFVRGDQLVDKPADFIRWADQLIRGARRRLLRFQEEVGGHPYKAFIGPHAEVWRGAHAAHIPPGHVALVATRTPPQDQST
jgi:hypothetical protein